MGLHAPQGSPRERVLAMGGAGVGKTSAMLQVAKWAERTGADTKVYVLDTDQAMERMLYGSGLEERVVVRSAYDWPEFTEGLDEFKGRVRPDDWVSVDLIGVAWEAAQAHYVDRVFGKGVDDFFLEARAANAKGSPLDGYKDWTVINKMYLSWVNRLIRVPCHLFAAAAGDAVSDRDDKALRLLFGGHGMKPRGQKHLGHQFHTVLIFNALTQGEHYLTTVKDRERPALEGAPNKDFVRSYLQPVAGWELK